MESKQKHHALWKLIDGTMWTCNHEHKNIEEVMACRENLRLAFKSREEQGKHDIPDYAFGIKTKVVL
jgi:hypothetical protein